MPVKLNCLVSPVNRNVREIEDRLDDLGQKVTQLAFPTWKVTKLQQFLRIISFANDNLAVVALKT